MTSSNNTQIIETACEYTLKYDEETEGLRDKTFHELVKEYCNQNGYKIGSLVSILIRKHIKKK